MLCIYLIHVEQEERSSLCVTGSTPKTDIGGGDVDEVNLKVRKVQAAWVIVLELN